VGQSPFQTVVFPGREIMQALQNACCHRKG